MSLISLYFLRVVEWLDEYHSGSFRQAQVSFSTRIPNAFPLGDAMTMSTHVCLYNSNSNHSLHYRDVVKPAASKNTGAIYFYLISLAHFDSESVLIFNSDYY